MNEDMVAVRVGRRGQITVPRQVRRWLDLQEGTRLAFARHGDYVVLQPLTKTLLDLRGSVPVSGPQDFSAIRREVMNQRGGERATSND